MKKVILFIFTLFFCNITSFSQYPIVKSSHPRIWIDSSRYVLLNSIIDSVGEPQILYNDILYAYNNWWITDTQLYLDGQDSSMWTWTWSSPYAKNEALLTVFFYKMTNDSTQLKRCRFIGWQLVNHINSLDLLNMEWYERETTLRNLSDYIVVLDQCYHNFPNNLRDSLIHSYYNLTKIFMDIYILSSAGNSYVSSHNTWNNIYCNQNTLVLYDSEGLSMQQKDSVRQWFNVIYDKLINGFIPCWTYYRDDDGGWNWGGAYSMWSFVDQFQLFENMRIGTNKNFYNDLPWIKNAINQYIYFIRPDNKCIHLGDGQTSIMADRVMYLHAHYYNDLRSIWLSQYWGNSQFLIWTIPKFEKLLYYDFSLPIVEKPNLPLDWWADKVGLSISRSSWDSNATFVTFFNSPSKRAAHEHRDNNSFTIFKNSPLIIDAGYYDYYASSHYKNYYQRTIAHNSICVFDSLDEYYSFDSLVSNDGGQIESTPLVNYDDIFSPEHQRGRCVKYAIGNNYSYNVADAQLSYDTTKLDFFRRRLLFIKPNKIIVVDHIHLRNTLTHQREVKWIAHFANKPVINGSLINTQVLGHLETYNGKKYFAKNGNGTVAVKTILPDSTFVTLIGGTGYEYWVDGVNYPPSIMPDTSYYCPGRWRIEVEPLNLNDSVTFLHTIAVGDSINIAVAGGTSLKSPYSIGVDWNDTIFYFSANGDTGKTYHVFNNVTGNRDVYIYAFDLKLGAYKLIIDGIENQIVSSDTNGVLQTSIYLTGGVHKIEISLNTNVQVTRVDKNIKVFPNPVKKILNIKLNDVILPNEVCIYDIDGNIIIKQNDKNRINVSSLASGLYFIKIKTNDNCFYSKFIKE